MSMKYLGESFDIHTSGRTLVFPHHENEIAIAQALTGKPLAKYWLHCDRVLMDGKKMDENLPRLNLEDLVEAGYAGRDIRYWLLSTHYRKPVRFSTEHLDAAKRSLGRLNACMENLRNVTAGEPYPELDQLLYDIKQGFIQAMDEDMNISAAIASIFRSVKAINKLVLEGMIDPEGAGRILEAFQNINTVLNIFDFEDHVDDPEIARLIRERNLARQERNWALADRLRETLQSRGVMVRDAKA
jgi:cysteinyl-tRNA synthetase